MHIDNLIEMHCHILPGIDDGSPDVETSLKMIEALKEQGAKKIVLTPHYYSNEISYSDFIKFRDESLNKLLAELPALLVVASAGSWTRRADDFDFRIFFAHR